MKSWRKHILQTALSASARRAGILAGCRRVSTLPLYLRQLVERHSSFFNTRARAVPETVAGA